VLTEVDPYVKDKTMQLTIKHANNPDIVHAVVRMNQKEFLSLAKYMHTPVGRTIEFPYRTKLTVRGRGWYRLVVDSAHKAVENIRLAVSICKRFLKEEEEKVEAAVKSLMPQVLHNTQLVAFSNYHSNGDRVYIAQAARPATQNQLQVLASKFGR